MLSHAQRYKEFFEQPMIRSDAFRQAVFDQLSNPDMLVLDADALLHKETVERVRAAVHMNAEKLHRNGISGKRPVTQSYLPNLTALCRTPGVRRELREQQTSKLFEQYRVARSEWPSFELDSLTVNEPGIACSVKDLPRPNWDSLQAEFAANINRQFGMVTPRYWEFPHPAPISDHYFDNLLEQRRQAKSMYLYPPENRIRFDQAINRWRSDCIERRLAVYEKLLMKSFGVANWPRQTGKTNFREVFIQGIITRRYFAGTWIRVIYHRMFGKAPELIVADCSLL